MNNYIEIHKNSIEYILQTVRNKLMSENVDEKCIETVIKKYEACIGNCISKDGLLYLTPQTKIRLEQYSDVISTLTSHTEITKDTSESEVLKLFSLEPYNSQINTYVLLASKYCDTLRLLPSKGYNPLNINTAEFGNKLDGILTLRSVPYLYEEFYTRLNEYIHWLMMLMDFNIVFIDTETCGLEDLRPVQITCVVTDMFLNNIIDKFNVYIKQTNIPQEAVNVHGLSEEILNKIGVDDKIASGELSKFLNKYSGKAVYVGHNIVFDCKVLQQFSSTTYIDLNIQHTFDTYRNRKYLIRSLSQGTVKKCSLENFLNNADIDSNEINQVINKVFNDANLQQHNAIYDTVALYMLLHKMEFMSFDKMTFK